MLTINADDHPLMSRMHKPDSKLGPDQQDKRGVVSIEQADVDQWLFGTSKEAAELVRAPAMDVLQGLSTWFAADQVLDLSRAGTMNPLP